ncbi:hypothetical protein, partial [Escherichia coli]|uniref:hypothetical protein n=1 Tax=Escherichia coli TaxID=562 RepID=UPI001BE7BF58
MALTEAANFVFVVIYIAVSHSLPDATLPRLIRPTKPNRRYCYGLQVFSWSGFPDCRHARHSAVRRCFFHPFRDFYAATGLCRDTSNGTPDFSTPY